MIVAVSVTYILIMFTILFIVIISKYQTKINNSLKVEDFEESVIEGGFEAINFTEDPLSLKDFLKADVSISTGKITLSNNCTGIVMTTTVAKTFSIQRGIEKKSEFRPNEHDVLADVLENFGVGVSFIKIRALSNDLYYANVFFKKGDQILNLDAKPSDAIAIASRFKTPVYINKGVLEKAGQNVC